jgi:hypothetical protein
MFEGRVQGRPSSSFNRRVRLKDPFPLLNVTAIANYYYQK